MSNYRPTYNMRSLEQAAGDAPTLAALQARIAKSQAHLERVKPLLPPALRSQVRSGPLTDGQWCILVRSAPAAVKIRQLLPRLLDALNQSGAEVSAIRVKIQGPTERAVY
ncbi:DciA family protein [Hydrogenophaga sp. 5NK40-0174]|uniref:DciA family protein n=1 Tax=Hydrogenophaga sp. 5NK40-0174 TaxID=3127649 RepID=UPI00310AB1DC